MRNIRPDVTEEVVFGTLAHQNPIVRVPPQQERLRFYWPGERRAQKAEADKYWFSMSRDMLEKHLLLLGGPGSGKTTIINLLLLQLRAGAGGSDVFVIFDTKGDYLQNFYRPGDMVIANGERFKNHPGYVNWNIFSELRAAGQDWEMAALEMAASLYADRKNATQPFFSNSAKDIFGHLLIHYYRHYRGRPDLLNNRYLVERIQRESTPFYKETFSEKINPDMVGLNSYFGEGKSTQGLGVFGEMKSMVYDCFKGSFAAVGDFSIREAVRQRGAKAIFIEYDMNVGQSLTPIYRLLVDLALKETLGRGSQGNGRVYFILDELKLLPNCMHLEDGLNLGRGQGCSIIAGMQSVEQMYHIYGREGGQVICGGFSNIFALSVSDYESRNYIQNLFGRNLYNYWYNSKNQVASVVREREGYVVEEWLLTSLTTGSGVVGLNGYPPFLFTFEPYPNAV